MPTIQNYARHNLSRPSHMSGHAQFSGSASPHVQITVPFSVFTATVLVGPSPCQCFKCALYTMPNSPVFDTTQHGTLS